MKKICLESPYHSTDKATLARNIEYAEKCLLDALRRGESPFASHLLYTRVLADDTVKADRETGIAAAMEWLKVSDLVAVYCDYGITDGMLDAMNYANAWNIPVEKRYLYGEI